MNMLNNDQIDEIISSVRKRITKLSIIGYQLEHGNTTSEFAENMGNEISLLAKEIETEMLTMKHICHAGFNKDNDI